MLQGVGGTYFVLVLLYLRYPLPIYPSRDPRVRVRTPFLLFFFCVIGELRAPLPERPGRRQSKNCETSVPGSAPASYARHFLPL